MGIALEQWLSGGGALVALWRAILWCFAAYLLALGIAALFWPGRARAFLSGFAANWRNNLLEATLRGLAGLAFVAAASATRMPQVSRIVGMFLLATALLMALLPRLHAHFAARATKRIFSILPLFGLLSIALAILLVWFGAGD